MGEKGNIADVRGAGGHVASATQAATRAQDLGLGGQSLSGSAPPAQGGGGGGGLLGDLADKVQDKATDIGLGGRGGAAGIVKGKDKDEAEDDES
jgi:hypothetical protein